MFRYLFKDKAVLNFDRKKVHLFYTKQEIDIFKGTSQFVGEKSFCNLEISGTLRFC